MCRMLIAIGDVDIAAVIDDFRLIAADKNERHENNEHAAYTHPDGWGFVYLENNKLKVIKSTAPFFEDEKVEELKAIKSPFYMLHARRKSQGKGLVRIENVHPFAVADYFFCHNGTINDVLEFDQQFTPIGDTDSERFFYYILSDVNGVLHKKILVEKYSKIKNYSAMNSILSDGNTSYIINWYASNPEYYTMKMLKKADAVIVSSEILAHLRHEKWKKLANQHIVKLDTFKIKA